MLKNEKRPKIGRNENTIESMHSWQRCKSLAALEFPSKATMMMMDYSNGRNNTNNLSPPMTETVCVCVIAGDFSSAQKEYSRKSCDVWRLISVSAHHFFRCRVPLVRFVFIVSTRHLCDCSFINLFSCRFVRVLISTFLPCVFRLFRERI